MAIYLSRQKGSGTATPITPSNASPVALVADNAVKPTAAGYAIESYDSVTPSSTPESVASGDIVKIGGSGVIVDAVPTPTSITPSNSSPVALTSNTPVNPTANGYAIESYHDETPTAGEVHVWSPGNILKINSNTACIIDHFPPPDPTSITPSNSSPASMTSGNAYQPTANGYAIASYQSKTPSTSGVSFNSGMVKMSSSGYAYSAQFPVFGGTPDKTFANNTAGTSGTATISVTKKPRYIVYSMWSRTSNYYGFTGIIDVTNNRAYRMGYLGSGAISASWDNWANFFTTVSASQVIYDYSALSYNSRVQIQIFY